MSLAQTVGVRVTDDRRASSWRAVLAIAALCAGCATSTASAPKAEGVEPGLQRVLIGYEYAEPLEQLWPAVRPALEHLGYAIRPGADDTAVATEWKQHFAGQRVVFTRYLVRGFRLPNGGAQIRAFRQVDTSVGDNPFEDTDSDGANHGGRMPITSKPSPIVARGVDHATLTRDLGLEWDVLRAATPDAAHRIEAMAAYQPATR